MINKLSIQATKRGFTLIETLIAVFILATSIAAPLTIASRGLNNATTAKNQITAFYLAQDAVEYVRFARDTNKLMGLSWLIGDGSADGSGPLSDASNLSNCISATGCFLDSTIQTYAGYSGYPQACGTACGTPLTSSPKYLYYNTTTGLYSYFATISATNVRQPFVRKVTLTQITATEYQLVVNVYWSDVSVLHNVTVTEDLFDWQ